MQCFRTDYLECLVVTKTFRREESTLDWLNGVSERLAIVTFKTDLWNIEQYYLTEQLKANPEQIYRSFICLTAKRIQPSKWLSVAKLSNTTSHRNILLSNWIVRYTRLTPEQSGEVKSRCNNLQKLNGQRWGSSTLRSSAVAECGGPVWSHSTHVKKVGTKASCLRIYSESVAISARQWLSGTKIRRWARWD